MGSRTQAGRASGRPALGEKAGAVPARPNEPVQAAGPGGTDRPGPGFRALLWIGRSYLSLLPFTRALRWWNW